MKNNTEKELEKLTNKLLDEYNEAITIIAELTDKEEFIKALERIKAAGK